MATLVLTAVGTALGGPLGGAVGALLGQQADAAIFAPKPRHGPRIGDLAVQTSSYGTAIPKLFGTMRVAGTVIWSTELQERRSASGGGKGRPTTVEYSYSASFAVALSGRRVGEVRRIWADGKLLRGAAGDFKSQTGFRLYRGDEDQAPDPLIASVEGIDRAPAYRGIAYAVFETMELGDYGNRIPSLTFEVVAEDGPVSVGQIAAELTGGRAVDAGTPALSGYAAHGDSMRGAVADMVEIMALPVVEYGAGLRIGGEAAPGTTIAGEAVTGPAELLRKGADAMPGEVSIAYYDPARDYQSGLQRASLGTGARGERFALAAVMEAGAAKKVAEQRLASVQAARVTARLRLGPRHAALRPGAVVRIEGQAGLWRVERWTLQEMEVALELVRIAPGSAVVPVASGGRALGAPDQLIGATQLMLFDLPIGEAAGAGGPRLLALTTGAGEGWRSASLLLSLDDGASWAPAGSSAAPATIGAARTRLGLGGGALIDAVNVVEVELTGEQMWLQSCTDAALARGANLAVLGRELIQFGVAEHVAGRRFRLSRLLRGRRGTEWASGDHQAGESFALLERETVAAIELPAAALGTEVRVRAFGRADAPGGVEARIGADGAGLRPPSPVHLRAVRGPGGEVAISWVRRSRAGWDWLNGADTPLGEDGETYLLSLRGGGQVRTFDLHEPKFLYAAGDALAGPLEIEVAQTGAAGLSRAARTYLN